MKASSFFWGIVVGVAASSWLAKGKLPMLSSNSSRNVVDQAKHKMMEMTFPGMDSFSGKADHQSEHQQAVSKVSKPISPKEKEENMNMLKDFIRSNPDVKHEVEQILTQTNTTIPGL
ncbi:hypothetical protein PAECIP112173_01774 [Paenibacillus sp. JJ-100]|uniref:hypothetical protein n=1 Tax=Paenibacillus sp. JJ-100 TaxID=2974896 RepID=UPI0022FFB124|nr:hypothetical protein [Paenibacillus sp. JJ-100]CAI6060732.1 hypothetical protein PAECIP112173_01774 [Paenibacillus sp. JJ-100]